MTHLGERLTDFVFGELSSREMDEARGHIAKCADCRQQVEHFEQTRSLLKMSPEVEPPRHIVFEFEKPRRIWNWLAPAMAAAAVIIAVLIATPMQVQWHDSQLTITFGRTGTPPVAVNMPTPVQSPATPAVQPIDYDRLAKQIESSERPWVLAELKKLDAEQTKRVEMLQNNFGGNITYLQSRQEAIDRDNYRNAANIQVLAQQLGAQ
jgi:anti-sigma factor RsiW